jgi:hypothetical protein
VNTPAVVTKIEADIAALVAKIEAGAKWFVGVATAAVKWVDASFPGAQQAIAQVISNGEASMEALETHSANGLADVVATAEDVGERLIANLLQAAGIDVADKALLSMADVAIITQVGDVAVHAVQSGLAKVLAGTKAVAAAVNA